MPALSHLMQVANAINVIYVANAGNGLTGVGYSDGIADAIYSELPEFLAVHTVKADGVALSLRAQDIFGRILTLFTLFAFAIGLLLIFLIFSLLAAERRAELGMARAVGMRRSHITIMLLFEGASYDTAAALLGVASRAGPGRADRRAREPGHRAAGLPIALRYPAIGDDRRLLSGRALHPGHDSARHLEYQPHDRRGGAA